ncbi:hypothetical protein BH09ACT10_BH09ACT10_06530 [soil metagenome]
MSSNDGNFSFVDLFAGIGGFHAALGALGGKCWFASEIDLAAKAIYEKNWSTAVDGDIVPITESRMEVPPHEVLAAGFPCQPFSKSGFQRGMSETRGTLFWNICRILKERKPAVVLLENVRNLAGPRHAHEWAVIVDSLRELGYRVSSTPTVFSPHLLPPKLGGRPQVRERVFILGTYVGVERAQKELDIAPVVPNRPVGDWNPDNWDLATHLPLDNDSSIENIDRYLLNANENEWIDTWNEFIDRVLDNLEGGRLPGFPIWADHLVHPDQLEIGPDVPKWKANFLRKNADFFERHERALIDWLPRVANLPPSRRKLEWQAKAPTSLDETVMHFRPSGIRAKKPTYLPALVAITQTSILGDRRRRITPVEAARLQGFPKWFDFAGQSDALTYKQLGNGVNIGAAFYVFRQHVLRDAEDIRMRAPGLVDAVLQSDGDIDELLKAPLEAGPLTVRPDSRHRGSIGAISR